MNKVLNIIVGIMLCLILLASVRNYSFLKLGVGQVHYLGGYTLTALSLYAFYLNKQAHSLTYLAPILYIVWVLIGIYRGAFEITSGWILNQYFHNVLSVIVPVIIFLFAFPDTIIRSFQIFIRFCVVYSFLSLGWNYTKEAYCFAFAPFYYIYLCFITKIPKKWILITSIAIAFVLAAYTNRSATIKIFVSLGVLCIFLLPPKIQKISLNLGHWLLYMIALLLLYLGLSGQYNVFNGEFNGVPTANKVIVSNSVEHKTNNRDDTRTFLYEEVLSSMVINDYVWTGRTPARGYYSPYFAESSGYIPGRTYGERIASEVQHLNTLNWLGVIGLVFITFVYLQGSCLALYSSKNKYVRCLALQVAFVWLYSWVENGSNFHILDITIYLILAICYSPYLRNMSDLEFEMWFKSIFNLPTEEMHEYNKYLFLKFNLIKKLKKQ